MASPSTDAIKKLVRSVKLPTNLSSDEIAKIRSGLRERALFSARVANTEFLDTVQRMNNAVLTGQISPETARRTLKSWLKADGYKPEPGEEGTITDLSSDQRLKLIIRTNVGMAKGYAQHVKAQSELDTRPFQQLYRRYQRKVPRDWVTRWRMAGGSAPGGVMMAPVNSPIWTAISRFGLPYPPFDFNSGMWVRPLTARQARRRAPEQEPKRIPDFNARLKSDVLVESRYLRRQLLKDLGPDYEVRGGVLKRKD